MELLFQLTTSQGGRQVQYRGAHLSKKEFQLTTSQGGRLTCVPFAGLTRVFQLTTSQGGRRVYGWVDAEYIHISTHDLARRSTHPLRTLIIELLFQLTTSQGGRRDLFESFLASLYFNSRPRKEVDAAIRSFTDTAVIFQLTTSQGGRRPCASR